MAVVRGHFRPEFLNRVDEIILFHRLRREDMGAIVDIQFKRLAKLLEDRKIELELDAKGAALARRQGLRSGLWRAPAEARDPEVRCRTRWRRCCSPARSATARRSRSARRTAR